MAIDDDSGSYGGASAPVKPDEPVSPLWWQDAEVWNERTADQVAGIVEALGGPKVVGVKGERVSAEGGTVEVDLSDPKNYGDMVYMYQRGRILVRDRDLERAQRVVEGRVIEGGVNGLTVLEVADTTVALSALDGALGVGVGFPNHVVHVSGQGGGACPATEPMPTTSKRYPIRDVHGDCTGDGVFVSLVDTGFDPKVAATTEWLAGVDGDPESYDRDHLGPYAGHGTFAAGVVRTMAPKCGAYVYGFLPHGGAIFESDIIAALQRALVQAPDIVSMSAGSHSRGDLGMLGFRVLWEQFASKGTVLVAAAGNDASRKPFYPAADGYAIGVGALDVDGSRAGYSNFGSWVDVYALGSDHVNAFPTGTYDYQQAPLKGRHGTFDTWLASWSGTSFATPLVSGVIAARMTWTGETGQQAAAALLALARDNAQRGVGAVVEPWMACRPGWGCS